MILLTGATGYVGGALLPKLVEAGYRTRCFARNPAKITPSGSRIEVVQGDVFDIPSLSRAMAGIDIAYYLIHSLGEGHRFPERDRAAAVNFADAARKAKVRRIIYLGGLGESRQQMSAHLRSRQEVGALLRASGVPVIEFRAAVIIGAGSLSFELLRALTERLPVMVTPKWVHVLTQPISIDDVVQYLLAAARLETGESEIFEIGGPDQVSYGDMMLEYARQRGLRRLIIPVPVLTPWLSSLWLALVTPAYAKIGRALIEGLRSPTLVRDDRALHRFAIRPIGMRQAIAKAMAEEERR
ncbi:MAG: NAD(P)H-binding protein [Armatimonadota bacterium]